MKVGKLIVIEGVDSSGKRTQSELLVKRLTKDGLAVAVADFPQYYDSFYGNLIGRYLRGEFGEVNEISPYLAALLYAGDRLEARDTIAKWLKEGKIIVANRYATSNLAFMGAKLKDRKKQDDFMEWVSQLEYNINKIPKPDIVIFLNVPVSITQDWIKNKEKRRYLGNKTKDIHEKDISYLAKVEQIYQRLVQDNDFWIQVDCVEKNKVLSIQEISEKVYSTVKKVLI
ncbi:dTMP kinase [Candidatus Woesearchaeota archaeon]|nr:dTMP kinase [Candidatus Woesearchaeota archaeon]